MKEQKKQDGEKNMIDPNAMSHTREIALPIDGVEFKFIWTRMSVTDLLMAVLGIGDRSEDSATMAIQRVIMKVVDRSQKGLLLEHFNNPQNYTLPQALTEVMLKPLTENVTRIVNMETERTDAFRAFSVQLITDATSDIFKFKSTRQKHADFEEQKENPDISPAEAIYNYLSECLPEERRNAFALRVYDKRNFTLPIKIYRRVADFLSRTAVTIGEPKLPD